MSNKRDYYEVLGVAQTAATDELRRAYRQLALKYHPDRNPNDAEAESLFKEATEAYGVLSDEQKRAIYDQLGHAGLEGGLDGGAGGDIFSQFQDLFSEFFGGAPRGRSGPRRGSDVRVQERLTLREAVLGCKREVVLRAPSPCEACEGSGAAKGSSRKTCTTCGGAGQVSSARGFVMFTQTCPRCHGQGSTVETPCPKCRGAGQTEKSKKVMVSFPPGIDTGQRLRVPGQGMAGATGAPPGDLYVDVEIEPDASFERDDLELITRLTISFVDAAVGTSVSLVLLDGSKLDVQVPAGSQPGDVIALKNYGVPRIDGRGKGALHVLLQVRVPRKISARARELLADLDTELRASEESSTTRALG